MSTRDLALSAAVGQVAGKDPIKNMSRAQAIQYCLDHGLPMALAVGVGDNVALQKSKEQAMAAQQQQKPPVIESNHQQFSQMLDQHAADQARQGGIADLPVSSKMFGQGMKKGGIVTFNGEEDSYVNTPAVRGMNPQTWAAMTDEQKALYLDQATKTPEQKASYAVITHGAMPDAKSALSKFADTINPILPAVADTIPAKPPTASAAATPTPAPPPAKPAAPAPAAPAKPAAPVTPPAAAAPKPAAPAAPAAAPTAPAAPTPKTKPTTNRGAVTDTAHAVAPDHADTAMSTSSGMEFTIPKDAPPWMTSLYNDWAKLSSSLGKKAEEYDPHKIEDFVAKFTDLNDPRNKDTKDYLTNLSQQSADALKRGDKTKWVAMINFGAAVANADPHAGLVAAIATGGKTAGPQYLKDLAEVKAAQNEIDKTKYLVNQHLKDGAVAAYEKQSAKFEMMNERKYQADVKFHDTMGQILGQLAHARIMSTQKAYFEPVESQQWRALGAAHPDWTPEQKIAAMPKGFAATTSAGAGVTRSEIAAASTALKTLTSGSDLRSFPGAPGHDQWEQEKAQYEAIIRAGGGNVEPPSPQYQEGQTATNPTTKQTMIFHNGQWVAK
jgi:hypothetical protein